MSEIYLTNQRDGNHWLRRALVDHRRADGGGSHRPEELEQVHYQRAVEVNVRCSLDEGPEVEVDIVT